MDASGLLKGVLNCFPTHFKLDAEMKTACRQRVKASKFWHRSHLKIHAGAIVIATQESFVFYGCYVTREKCNVLRTLTRESVLRVWNAHALSSPLGHTRRSLGDRNGITWTRTISKCILFLFSEHWIRGLLPHAQMISKSLWSYLKPSTSLLSGGCVADIPIEIRMLRDYNFPDNLA